jgi:serine/threonine protein kinase
VIKIPATDHRADAAALERLLSEEWIARRLNNPHLLKAHPQRVNRSRLYVALEYVKGETLAQRIRDNTRLKIDEVRDLSEQLMQGIQAMHRSEIIHQDIRAENIIIDEHGTLKLIDFGSSFCGSWFDLEEEKHTDFQPLGTEQFSAPESILGQIPTVQSDIFCVGVLVYYMLSARLPYGAQVARIKTPDEILRLQYIPLKEHGVSVPDWFEQAIRKALAPQARQRYTEVSEFAWDLRHPNPKFVGMRAPPLIEQHPILIWKLSSALLLLLLIMSIYLR